MRVIFKKCLFACKLVAFSYVAVSSSDEFQSCTEGSTDDERELGHKAKKQHIDVLPTNTPIVTLSKLKFVC